MSAGRADFEKDGWMQQMNGHMAPAQVALVSLSAIVTVSVLIWVLRYAGYGIDFTDESFYLVWISNPFLYDWSLSQFGYIYHPLYLLASGDISHLRQLNVLITFFLAWILVHALIKEAGFDGASGKLARLVVSAGFATSSLILFDTWLLTPSYNSLTLQALLISAIGLRWSDRNPTRQSISGWALLAFGGWLAFMAKPSTAAALALLSYAYLHWSRKISLAGGAVTLFLTVALLCASALVMDGTVQGFVQRLQVGLEFSGLLGGGHSLGHIIRMDGFRLSAVEIAFFIVIACVSYGAGWLVAAHQSRVKVGVAVVMLLMAGVTLSISWGWMHPGTGFGDYQGVLVGAVTLAAAVLGLKMRRRAPQTGWPRPYIAQFILLIALPYAYAFGSNGNYWKVGCAAAVFWLVSGLWILVPAIQERGLWRVFLPFALVTQLVVALLLHKGLENPYRQDQPLWLNTHETEIGRKGATVRLSDGYGTYVERAMEAARSAGFTPGTPVIDLSGQSPGVLYAMRAESIGQAWMIGGYPGSLRLTGAALRRVDCARVVGAWVLHEPDGPRSIPARLTSEWGGDIRRHYEEVAQWRTAEGAGGYPNARVQILLKPTRDLAAAVAACEAARTNRAPN